MTSQEINRKIAECLGWKNFTRLTNREFLVGEHPDLPWARPIPNYFEDLNACHEMEKSLDVDIHSGYSPRYAYSRELYRICMPEQPPYRATSQQRCEAFLRVRGLWTEQPNTKTTDATKEQSL